MEDFLYSFLKYYEILPSWLKVPVGKIYTALPVTLRHGLYYIHYQKRINQFCTYYSESNLQQEQEKLLFSTVNQAISNIPFYKHYAPINSINDFKKMPIVNKEIYLKDIYQFCSIEKRRRLTVNTGGSSGTPLTFFIEKGRTRPKEKAHFNWFWGLYGYQEGAPLLMLRGKSLRHNALFEYQSIKHCLNVSCYELTQANVSQVLNQIKFFKPRFIHAYPSSLDVFMRCVGEERRHYLRGIKAIFLGSEFLSSKQGSAFKHFFDAPVCTWYGHSESVLHGGTLPGDTRLAFFPFYGFFELIDDNNVPVTVPGCCGRIIGTSFDNHVMPFIRYDTGDRGTLGEPITFGQVQFPTLQFVDGRNQDVIYLNDHSEVSLTAFIFGQHLSEFARIREMQLEQTSPGFILLRVVPLQEFSPADKKSIVDFLEASVSGKIRVKLETVEHIEKTVRGKHRFLIQHYSFRK